MKHDPFDFDGPARTRDGASGRRVGVWQVAAALEVAPSGVVKWSQRLRATGSCAPAKVGGRRPRKIDGDHLTWARPTWLG